MSRAARPSGDEGVSNVLGAILMFALLVMTLVVVETEFVPVWEEDREARHMEKVRDELALLKSDLDRQVDNRTDLALTNVVTLERSEGFRFFRSGGGLSGVVSFEAGTGAGVEVASPRLTILESAGQGFYGLAEEDDWLLVDDPPVDTYSDVTQVRALRVRIDMHEEVCDAYAPGDTATLVVTEDGGGEVGRAVLTWLEPNSSEYTLRLDIYANFDGEAVADDQVSQAQEFFFQQLCQGNQDNFLDYEYFDLLDPSLLFDSIINSADFPIALDVDNDGLEAGYVVVYDDSTGSTETGSGGGVLGLTEQPYDPDPFEGGILRFAAGNSRFVEQEYVLEHGAVLRVQGDAAAMVVPPSFTARVVDDTTSIGWTLPSLSGDVSGLQGSRTASVVTQSGGTPIDLRATAGRFVLTIPTEHEAAWEDFMRLELRQAGLDESDNEFDVDVSVPGEVTVTIEGTDVDLGAIPALDDLSITFQQADIETELRA